MNGPGVFFKEYLIKSLDDSEERIRFEAIHSLSHLRLLRLEDVREAVLSAVATDTDRVSGLAIASLMWAEDHHYGQAARVLSGSYGTRPVSTLICHMALGVALAAAREIRVSFDPCDLGETDAGEDSARSTLTRIGEDVFRWYVLPYLLTLIRSTTFAESDQSEEFGRLTTGPFCELMSRVEGRLLWSLRFLSATSKTIGESPAVRHLLASRVDNISNALEVQQWLIGITGQGTNVIDAIYRIPETREERRRLFLELVETGGEDTSMAWWTRSSAIEKLGNEQFVSDPIVCRELIRRLREFKVAEGAGATRQVGMFTVMYVPTWPYAEKGIYRELTQTLSKIGVNDTALELRELMTDSPYPELLLDAMDGIEQRRANGGPFASPGDHDHMSDEAVAAYRRGLDAETTQDWGRAIADYQRAVTDSPSFMSAWYQLWWASMQIDKFEEALTALNHVDALDPESPDVVANLGVLHAIRGDNQRAEELLDRAIELDPSCQEAWVNKAALVRKRDGEMAEVACLREAVIRCPFSPSIFQRAQELNAFSRRD